jgi:hypothetical protein
MLFKATAAGPAWTAEPDFMSWRLAESRRVRDGGQAVEYELKMPQGVRNIEKLEVFYVLRPWNLPAVAGQMFGPDEIYSQGLTNEADSARLKLYCGRLARLDLLAGAILDGRFYLARTFQNVYGDSGRSDPGSRRVPALPDWPALDLAGGAAYYRAQAGEELRFHLDPARGAPVSVEVFEEGRPAEARPALLEEGLYSYSTPPYPLLSAPSYSVTRDMVFVARTGEGAVLSYYLPVGRHRYGHVYLQAGLATVAVTAALAFLAVRLAGRSFKWR